MTYTPDQTDLLRIGEYVSKRISSRPFFAPMKELAELPDELIDGVKTGALWPDEETRTKIESALGWREGDMEWIGRGGAPSTISGTDLHRRWLVTVTVQRIVEAPTSGDAHAALCDPIREALGGGEGVGITEVSATNMALIEQRNRDRKR